MLSLIAGPIPVGTLLGLDADPTSGLRMDRLTWVDHYGLLVSAIMDTGTTHYMYVMQLNGKVTPLHTYGGMGIWGWSAVDGFFCWAKWPDAGWCKVSSPITLGPLVGQGTIDAPVNTHHITGDFGVMPDRILMLDGGWGYIVAQPLAGGDRVAEAPTHYGEQLFYAGQKNNEHRWWLSNRAGTLRMWNATSKTWDARVTSFGSTDESGMFPIDAVAYSVKHDLFAVLRGWPNPARYLFIYANEPVAATISAPTITPAARAGVASAVRVRVLGDQSEPCAGRRVTFTASEGAFERATVETDADGYADARYYAATAGGAGRTITATLDDDPALPVVTG